MKKLLVAILSIATIQVLPPSADAAPAASQARPGNKRSSTRSTNMMGRSNALKTAAQRLAIRSAGFGGLAPVFGGGGRNGLPKTQLDSFVRDSGMNPAIYGDEGSNGIPPFMEFTPQHRIERGISSSGLTTGHASSLAPAWGGDEFVDNEGTTQSGGSSGGGSPANWNGGGGGGGANLRGDMSGPGKRGGSRGQGEVGMNQNQPDVDNNGRPRRNDNMPFDMPENEDDD
ncbi:MAG: hypothetical protein K2Z81_23960 [Cyanobacteria bacterium]|nr:hypothetical protein [Cyanobacteriota bacterium]